MFRRAEIPFRFELPVETFYKAGEPGKERRIGGVISTESKDRQGEVVLQRGLDFAEFLANGWINDNHSKETTGIVGYPLKVDRVTVNGKPATAFEGYLLEGHAPSDKIWNLAQVLQKTGRRLGFSIEGAVVRREGMHGEIVAKAKVRNVAITNAPVNTDTELEVIAKSLQAMESEGWEDRRLEQLQRAMMAGQGFAQPGVAVPGLGAALRPESMEMAPKTATYRRPRSRKALTKAEALEVVHGRFPGLTDSQALRILNHAAAAAHHGGNDGSE